LAHQAIDEAFVKKVATMWDTILRDVRAHHSAVNQEAIKRFNDGYRLAVVARATAHSLIDQFSLDSK